MPSQLATLPLTPSEDLLVLPGPALLADVASRRVSGGIGSGGDPSLRDHRARWGEPTMLGLDALHALTDAAGVRGRGGAGFSFARKLATAARHRSLGRAPFVVVNASEGEPASAKDAALARTSPHLVLDGALIAARALGAREIHVIVPGDRPRTRGLLLAAVAERTTDPASSGVRWLTHTTQARFVAGQARAVLELMAGRPGLPVTAWEPEAVRGHRGRATLLSNAETWAHVGLLALEGLGRTLGRGTAAEPGTTLLTVHAPGRPVTVQEVEHGLPLGAVLPASARSGPILLGGFHGTWAAGSDVVDLPISAAAFRERRLALGAGVVIAPGLGACAVAWTERIVAHLASESAGRCGPCRNGLPALATAVADLAAGRPGARAEVARLCGLVEGRGACAHPDGTSRLVASLLQAFPEEVARHEAGRCGARQHLIESEAVR
ncbi:NADH-ubiquinone oxidoreductase-F iron-sulfur binding region domain-containing protein [Nocardioides sp.]|uniref:NADH-ubiquinone oxidoreductase-F iron-sulfur binding region domain-containing protein n=1 Tax=Nocardioides sp. TaxID=35761 RepID=UPI003513917F